MLRREDDFVELRSLIHNGGGLWVFKEVLNHTEQDNVCLDRVLQGFIEGRGITISTVRC